MKRNITGKKIAGACAALVCIIALAGIGIWKMNTKTNQDSTADTKSEENITLAEDERSLYEQDVDFLKSKGIPVPDKTINFDDLQKNDNKDIYAWIYIPDTQIDYPIVQHDTDNMYYLNYSIDGTEGYPGCIYSENYNSKNFTDNNTVLYGHNMRDGSMFGDLNAYLEENYYNEHPYIYIYTPGRIYAYEVFAAYKSDDRHLLLSYDFSVAGAFENYLTEAMTQASENGRLTADWQPSDNTYVLTLSTCVAGNESRRFLVQGRLIVP